MKKKQPKFPWRPISTYRPEMPWEMVIVGSSDGRCAFAVLNEGWESGDGKPLIWKPTHWHPWPSPPPKPRKRKRGGK